jgi:hypothetical protein
VGGFAAQPASPAFPAPPPPSAAPAAPLPRPKITEPEREAPGPIPAGEGRLRGFLVNVISLAALLAVATALLALWQGEGDASSLLARLRSLTGRGGVRSEAPVVVEDVTSGLFDVARGARVLFVRGRIEARAAVAGPVQVRAEILQGHRLLARAESPAGAFPTPEELRAVDGPDGVRRLETQLASRAATRLGPGESAPFLVVFSEFPPRLSDLTFRVFAEVAGAPRG